MHLDSINGQSDAAKVFTNCRNISGATISDGVPVEWDVVSATDGNSVTRAKSGSLASLFVGLSDASMADSAYGLVQTYGFRTSAYVSAASAGSTPGTWLQAVSGYLTDATMSANTTSGWTYVTLMETRASSAISYANVFVRAL